MPNDPIRTPKTAMVNAARRLARAHAHATRVCADNVVMGKNAAVREYIEIGPKILARIQQTIIVAERVDNMLNGRWPDRGSKTARQLCVSYKARKRQ